MEKLNVEFTRLECISLQIYPVLVKEQTLKEKRARTVANLKVFGGAEALLPLVTKENKYQVFLSVQLGNLRKSMID